MTKNVGSSSLTKKREVFQVVGGNPFPQPTSPPNDTRSTTRMVRRINLELPEKAAAQLEWLERETGSSSSAEVIRNALKLYYGLVHEVVDGGSISIIESSGVKKELKIFL